MGDWQIFLKTSASLFKEGLLIEPNFSPDPSRLTVP